MLLELAAEKALVPLTAGEGEAIGEQAPLAAEAQRVGGEVGRPPFGVREESVETKIIDEVRAFHY
jgi:hypothetical protein